jgi:hypothetical protein
MQREQAIQNLILREFGTKPWLRLWRQNTGAARFGRQFVRFGVPGQADLSGILPGGRRLEIEVKSPTGVQSDEQRDFQALIERFGGVYILARSVEDVRRRLQSLGYEVEGAREASHANAQQ